MSEGFNDGSIVGEEFGEFLFVDKLGRIRAKRFNTWLHRTCKKVKIPERSTHKIRKTYASILLSSKVDERLITLQMGHTDISTTKGIYYFNNLIFCFHTTISYSPDAPDSKYLPSSYGERIPMSVTMPVISSGGVMSKAG